MRDDPREWEHWLVIIGACLSSKTAREQVFASLEVGDCPYKVLKGILGALKGGDADEIRQAFSEFYFLNGVEYGNGCLSGIVEKVKQSAERRKRIEKAQEELRRALQ